MVRVNEANFPTARLGPITFSELPVGTRNPVYTPDKYTGGSTDPSAPTVSFAAFFQGQIAPDIAFSSNPTAPLTLNTPPGGQQAAIGTDLTVLTSPVLNGAGDISRPLAVRFSPPVVAVGVSS